MEIVKPYTPAEVAEMFGVSVSTIYREIREHRLKARLKRGSSRGYRITKEAISDWLENGYEDVQ